MAKTALEKITARAKQIRRAMPKKTWQDCVTAASKEYRAGKLGKPAKVSGIFTASGVKRTGFNTGKGGGTNTGKSRVGAIPQQGRLKVQMPRKVLDTKKTRTVVVKKVQTLAGIPSGTLREIDSYKGKLLRAQAALKGGGKGLTAAEKSALRKQVTVYKATITNLKKLI